MATSSLRSRVAPKPVEVPKATASGEMAVALLTGGIDKPYVHGLTMELISKGVRLDVIGSDELDSPEMRMTPGLNFLNLRGDQREGVSFAQRVSRVLSYYARLLWYAATAQPKIFHILWNNKFMSFDRTLLMLYYKLLGKKIALTAHNVNAAKRDGSDSAFNRMTLRIQYRLADCIFVHTERMKTELVADFGVAEQAVTVIPFGINNAVPDTDLTPQQAKCKLGLDDDDKVILFFGRIGPYKGLEILVAAFQQMAARRPDYRLLIVGKPKRGAEDYFDTIRQTIHRELAPGRVIQKIEFIPDEDTEIYFKAADVLALPYTQVFQSGVLFLGYSFGLPAIAADVGSFNDDIIEGRTGFLFPPGDPAGLASTLETYFASELFQNLNTRRREIRQYAHARHSWNAVGDTTTRVYAAFMAGGKMQARRGKL
jgi:glycosyltransferase involved in cell wall biosynthesis